MLVLTCVKLSAPASPKALMLGESILTVRTLIWGEICRENRRRDCAPTASIPLIFSTGSARPCQSLKIFHLTDQDDILTMRIKYLTFMIRYSHEDVLTHVITSHGNLYAYPPKQF
ncbi:hypothetical protein GGD83_004566 [Rhodoblastus sphagnicola]|nr:hypothetical protein [Rhodoblastus sphagnicola]